MSERKIYVSNDGMWSFVWFLSTVGAAVNHVQQAMPMYRVLQTLQMSVMRMIVLLLIAVFNTTHIVASEDVLHKR